MNYDMSSYFEDPEFKEALAKYEGMVESHTPAYFEADELIDIAEYYASKGRHKDADKAIDLAIQLHPDNTDALIFRIRSLMLQNKKEEAKVVAQLIANSTDRECRFLQADMLMEENRIEEAEEIFKQLAMDEEYEVDTLLDIIQDYITLTQAVDVLWDVLQKKGIAAVCESSYLPCELARPRKQEVFACVNRYRRLGL